MSDNHSLSDVLRPHQRPHLTRWQQMTGTTARFLSRVRRQTTDPSLRVVRRRKQAIGRHLPSGRSIGLLIGAPARKTSAWSKARREHEKTHPYSSAREWLHTALFWGGFLAWINLGAMEINHLGTPIIWLSLPLGIMYFVLAGKYCPQPDEQAKAIKLGRRTTVNDLEKALNGGHKIKSRRSKASSDDLAQTLTAPRRRRR